MSLSDPLYLAFLGAVFFLYYLFAPGMPRRVLLLAASYFFYFELSRFCILVLWLVTLVTYLGALGLRPREEEGRRFRFFVLVATVALIPLLVFKYLGALLGLGGEAIPLVHSMQAGLSSLTMPIGISFFTFAALGYLIDVYLEVAEPEQDFGRVALFLAFFPVITAGPIERAGSFMSQFGLTAKFSSARALSGLRLIFIGLMLKLLFAEVLQKPADSVFIAPGNCLPIEQLFGLIFYVFYLYADFAGYTLIAIGSANLFGLDVRPNFHQPFLSATVADFWRNWHISLSSWVRDYIFAPLRTHWRRYPKLGMAAALGLAFLIIGAWHGAKWGYLIFGAMHGLLVIGSTFTLAGRDAFWKTAGIPAQLIQASRMILTFILVALTFVAFRANCVRDAMVMYQGIFSLELVREFASGAEHLFFHRDEPLHFISEFRLRDWGRILVLIFGD
ncbi:MAG TPA: MBOAT family O-acyltransferase, partial [Candidatus Methylacidiphilales bacterium]|nr:MBOAT family O-acyltransferase [Candidatus Methylacidiphilales bacterium]